MAPGSQELDDVLHIKLPAGQAQHKLQRLVLLPADPAVIQVGKDQYGQDRRPLVAVHKGMVQDQRVQ